jgi:hypothetical protein
MKKVMILLFGIALIMSFSVNAQDQSKTLTFMSFHSLQATLSKRVIHTMFR